MRQVHFATNRLFDAATNRFGGVCCDPPDELRSGVVPCDVVADPVPEGSCDLGALALEPGGIHATVAAWLAAAAASGATPLLFTHGFNHAFAEAMSRTAKLCAWLEAGGGPKLLPLAFTWPSGGAGSVDSYGKDGAEVGKSGLALAKLVAAVAALRRPQQSVVYMAHSMGVRATRYGMQAIGPMLPNMTQPAFDQAFLMAGDDVADVFDDSTASPSAGGMRAIAKAARHVTVGVNRDDGVVWLIAGSINRGDRLGAAGPARPEDLPANVKVVDYSEVVLPSDADRLVPSGESSPNWIGHQYYRNAPRVREDLVAALQANGAPEAVAGRRWGQPGAFGIREVASRLYPA